MLALMFLTIVVPFVYTALPLPSYITPCKRSDPEFDTCALRRAKEALPNFIDGDRKYQVPNLNPLIIPEIRLSETGNGMILSNLNIHGFKDTIMDSIHYDFTAMKMALQFTVPNMMILAQYNVSEKLMYLPIAGHGYINITLANCKIKFESDYLLEDKEGHQHLVVKSPTTKVEPTRAYIHLSNLFNGDTFLGNEMNRFIDDHWERIFKDVSPAVVEATSKVTANIINRISAVVPYNDVFPE